MPTSPGDNALNAVHLYNDLHGNSVFERGTIPCQVQIKCDYFFAQAKIEPYQKSIHPAPRRQYVITLKGTLRFSVSDGSTFILEPGIILIAEDIEGEGHSWELIEGDEWIRLYIPFNDNAANTFIPYTTSIDNKHNP